MAADLSSTIDVDDDTGFARLRVHGDVDIATVEALRHGLDEMIDDRPIDSDGRPVIIDLGGVEFIGIAGIRVLVEAAVRLDAVGSRLVLSGSRPGVSRILELWQQVGGPAPWEFVPACQRPSRRLPPSTHTATEL